MTVPFIPEDVLRLFLECAAWNDKKTALALSSVSQEVQRWTEPAIYELVMLDRANFKAFTYTASMRPPTFFASHVKRVWCYCGSDPPLDDDEIQQIIFLFRGATSISIKAAATVVDPALVAAHPVSASPRNLPVMPNLTHLEIFEPDYEWTPAKWAGIEEALPFLSHISLHIGEYKYSPDQSPWYRSIQWLLSNCRYLQMILLTTSYLSVGEVEMYKAYAARGIVDSRIIMLFQAGNKCEDWKAFGRGEVNQWSRAEEKMRIRKARRVS